MDDWQTEIANETRRALQSSHAGRLRTSARRIAGIALSEYRRTAEGVRKEESFLALLTDCANDPSLPEPIRGAAYRLSARVGTDFSSPSVNPMGDADIIVDFVRSAAEKS